MAKPSDKSQFCGHPNLELAFIRASRNNQTSGIKGTICRGEFLDFVLRLAAQMHSNYQQKHGKTRYPDNALEETIDVLVKDYMMDTYLESEIIHERNQIRQSRRINALLEDNTYALQEIFEKYANINVSKSLDKGSYNIKRSKYITVDQAVEIFMSCYEPIQEKEQVVPGTKKDDKKAKSPSKAKGKKSKSPPKKRESHQPASLNSLSRSSKDDSRPELEDGAPIGPLKLRQLFHFSKIALVDDSKEDKYQQMILVEFIEMVCRVALKDHQHLVLTHGIQSKDIDVVVYEFIDKLFECHQVFPLDVKNILKEKYRNQESNKDSDLLQQLSQKFSKQISAGLTIDSDEETLEVELQTETTPIDQDILEEEEVYQEYIRRQQEIDELIKKELAQRMSDRGMI